MLYTIRRLTIEEWPLWKALSLEMLQLHPESFGLSYEEAQTTTDEKWKEEVAQDYILGAFVDTKLIGSAGFYQYKQTKTAHKATLSDVYLKAAYRGQKIADKLITGIVDHARTQVLQLHLSVNTTAHTAIKLYQRHGFETFGTEPRGIRVGDSFYDLHLMVLKLD